MTLINRRTLLLVTIVMTPGLSRLGSILAQDRLASCNAVKSKV